MRIALALLADHAVAHADGKLYVTGGGIRSLDFPFFPASQPHLALALGIELDPDEFGSDHLLSIEAAGPTKEPIFTSVRVTFMVPAQADSSEPGYIHFVSNMDNVAFPVEGSYEFRVLIDELPVGNVPVRARRGGEDIPEEVQANAQLVEGYRLFVSGDADQAEAIFREVVARFPKVAGGHNNLGFVLLARGRAGPALEEFGKARELGYAQEEVSEANVACAQYVLGDGPQALRGFQQCLRRAVFRSSATLFGIGEAGLFPVNLASAGEYASLMELNAAWSASAAGDKVNLAHYLAAAEAAELTLRSDPGAQRFVDSVRALRAKTR